MKIKEYKLTLKELWEILADKHSLPFLNFDRMFKLKASHLEQHIHSTIFYDNFEKQFILKLACEYWYDEIGSDSATADKEIISNYKFKYEARSNDNSLDKVLIDINTKINDWLKEQYFILSQNKANPFF